MGSAYPGKSIKIIGFHYADDIYLTRKIKAVRERNGKDVLYVVASPYNASVSFRDGKRVSSFPIEVPSQFLTDLSTVLCFLRSFIGRVGPQLEASVVHSWLYVAWQVEKGGKPTQDKHKFADDVLRAAMKEAGVGCIKRTILYCGSRWLGGCLFRKRDERIFAR